ncbi:hypothetical protein X801_05521, partial [Opisthorchis viverrini]
LDEEGVTAAAATLFTVCASFQLLQTISVDHPFFFALVCDSTMPVFVGHTNIKFAVTVGTKVAMLEANATS